MSALNARPTPADSVSEPLPGRESGRPSGWERYVGLPDREDVPGKARR